MRRARRGTDIRVTASRSPLSTEERDLLIGDLTRRGISPTMLEMVPPSGRGFLLLRALAPDGRLLGATPIMSVRPFVSLKQNLGEGNHVGWDTAMYLAEGVDRPQVVGALLAAMARRSIYYAMYFGQLDPDVAAALSFVRHRLLETDYCVGQVDCTPYGDVSDYLAGHKRLRRHLRTHAKAGGAVHVHEGPVDAPLAAAFSDLVLATYRHHGGIGRWQFRDYARRTCGNFFTTSEGAVHIYTTCGGSVTGLQSFVRHRDRLELSEGGFDRSSPATHAYEAIITRSIEYAIDQGIGSVGYGGIWNEGKDRYTDKAGRTPVYLLQLYNRSWQYRLFGDRFSAWAFRWYFGGRFGGASAATVVVSRRGRV